MKKYIHIVLAVLVALAAVGGAAYLWQKSYRQAPRRASVLEVPEIGVRIKLSPSTADLVYKVTNDHSLPNSKVVAAVNLGTTNTTSECGYGYLGSILKIEGSIPVGQEPLRVTGSDGSAVDALLRQFDGFYLQHVLAQNGCELQNGAIFPSRELNEEVVRLVKSLELIK